jgi:hypothetical protein
VGKLPPNSEPSSPIFRFFPALLPSPQKALLFFAKLTISQIWVNNRTDYGAPPGRGSRGDGAGTGPRARYLSRAIGADLRAVLSGHRRLTDRGRGTGIGTLSHRTDCQAAGRTDLGGECRGERQHIFLHALVQRSHMSHSPTGARVRAHHPSWPTTREASPLRFSFALKEAKQASQCR